MLQSISKILLAVYCLLSLCSTTTASSFPRGRHSLLHGGNIASSLPNTVNLAAFVKRKAFRATFGYHHKCGRTWTIQAGDTGNGIAARLSIQFVQLAYLNQGVDWYNLRIGQVLNIPCNGDAPVPVGSTGTETSFYTVVAGDTGNDIAARAGISFEELDSANPGVNWYNLQIGQILKLPSPQTAETMTSSITTTSSTTSISTEQSDASTPTIQFTSTSILSTTTPDASTPTIKSTNTSTLSTTSISTEQRDALTPTTQFTNTSTFSTTSTEVSPTGTTNQTDTTNQTPQNNTLYHSPVVRAYQTQAGRSRDLFSKRAHKAGSVSSTHSKRVSSVTTRRRSTSPTRTVSSVHSSTSSPRTYSVKAGDTGYQIAAAYDISFSALDQANPGITWTNLQINQVLSLPSSSTLPSSLSTSKSVLVPQLAAVHSTRLSNAQSLKSATDTYSLYTGPAITPPYPEMQTWLSFSTMWLTNLPDMGQNCVGSVPTNTASENRAIKSAILSVSSQTGVHPSFILAIIKQESNGCVRVPTTWSYEGLKNPGIMQSFDGTASCNSGGVLQQPCPNSVIEKMVMDGVLGNQGVGIVPALEQAARANGVTWSAASIRTNKNVKEATKTKVIDEAVLYYQAARIYNSGSLPADGDLSGATGSTRCYVSDIVNRLLGWVDAASTCYL